MDFGLVGLRLKGELTGELFALSVGLSSPGRGTLTSQPGL